MAEKIPSCSRLKICSSVTFLPHLLTAPSMAQIVKQVLCNKTLSKHFSDSLNNLSNYACLLFFFWKLTGVRLSTQPTMTTKGSLQNSLEPKLLQALMQTFQNISSTKKQSWQTILLLSSESALSERWIYFFLKRRHKEQSKENMRMEKSSLKNQVVMDLAMRKAEGRQQTEKIVN